MMLKLHKPFTLYKQGKRKNNEDAFYVPNDINSEELFIVCDGVGGANKGEIASRLACDTFAEYVENAKSEKKNKAFWQDVLKFTEQKFSQQIIANEACKGMGTTLVLTYFKAGKAQVVWCGDSRLYQFRNGKIIFKTKDHSFVQKLVDDGQITEQEALTHPRKNIILRAINGSENPTELDFEVIEDIQAKDLFLLCSDGIIEGLTDEKLEQIVAFGDDDYDFIIEQIDTFCQTHSNDNYTCVVIPIAEIEKINQPITPPPEKEKSFFSNKIGLLSMGALALFLLAAATFFLTENKKNIEVADKTKTEEKAVIEPIEITQETMDTLSEGAIKDTLLDAFIALEKNKITVFKPNNSKTKYTKVELEARTEGKGLTEAEQKYKAIKDSLKATMLEEYFKIDSLRKSENDTTGRFFEVQDLVRARYLYSISEFSAALDAMKNWTNHEWKDSLMTQKDWLILHELYSTKEIKSNSDIEALTICEDNLKKYLPTKPIDSPTLEKITSKKDTIQ